MEVKSFAAMTANTPLEPYSFHRKAPKPDEVLIEIQYCGICHSDIHKVRNEWGGSLFPMVPGHEIVGVVTEIGNEVRRFKPGDKVGVGCCIDSCRHCESCREGLEQYCEEGMTLTYDSMTRDGSSITRGGYSSHIVVNELYVLNIPDTLPLKETAPLLCAGITMYSPLVHWKAGKNTSVAIVGLGGLGHMGVKLAHAMGAKVSVISHSKSKEADAVRLGADTFILSTPEILARHNNSFDLIINTVSAYIDWNVYLQLLKRDGTMVNVGLPQHEMNVAPFSLITGRKKLAGSLIGGIKETQTMLDFCGKHGITADIECIPIQSVNEAFTRVIKGDVRFRFVIDMTSLG